MPTYNQDIEKTLLKFDGYYKSADAFGASKILREFLEIDKNVIIPLSLSHGVDIGHLKKPMDIESIEPIHWSYNNSIHDNALKIKSSIEMPHPWLMLKEMRSASLISNTLVIGPPPSKTNDTRLLKLLKKENIHKYDILLKDRGEKTASSRLFWESHGIKVVTAGKVDNGFYERLFSLFTEYNTTISPTLSSALFFAKSLGHTCKILTDYSYVAYETENYLDQVHFNSITAKKFIELLESNNQDSAYVLACQLLGVDYIENKYLLKKVFLSKVKEIKNPIFFHRSASNIEKLMMVNLFFLFKKHSFILENPFKKLKIRKKAVTLTEINEIDVWKNGVNDKNFKIKEIPYKKGVTEPGSAADWF